MKKIILALAVIATVACFSSCNKKCTCKTSTMGETTTETISLNELEEEYGISISKCSDLEMDVFGTFIKCE